jgi:hypothetical protein
MAFKLTTIENIKRLSKGSTVGDSNALDYLLDQFIVRVGEMFALECNLDRVLQFDKVAVTEYHSLRVGQKSFGVNRPPVSPAVAEIVGPPAVPAIEALRLYQDTALPRVYGSSTELIKGTDFFLDEKTGLIEHVNCFAGGNQSIKVTYTGLYLTGDAEGVPPSLQGFAEDQVKLAFDRREEIGLTGRSIEGGSISFLRRLMPAEIEEGLHQNYRIRIFN